MKICAEALTTGAISAHGGKKSKMGTTDGFMLRNLTMKNDAAAYSDATVAAPAAARLFGSVTDHTHGSVSGGM